MPENDACQYLPWDSAFFGRRIARLRCTRLDPSTLHAVLAWCRGEAIDCLYFLADAGDSSTVCLAEDHNFRLVDVRVTLAALTAPSQTGPESISGSIRECRSTDQEALRAIARIAHVDSRFYTDPRFPVERCAALYETWIVKSCRGGADVVLVADVDNQPAGYVSCHSAQERGEIGLLGVASRFQGRGLGGRLVAAALEWFARREVAEVTVVTQARNTKAQRLYQRAGFLTRDVHLWYHRWFIRANEHRAA